MKKKRFFQEREIKYLVVFIFRWKMYFKVEFDHIVDRDGFLYARSMCYIEQRENNGRRFRCYYKRYSHTPGIKRRLERGILLEKHL